MFWWGNGAGWGGLVVLVLVMAGFWALVVAATMALFRGAHNDPVARRRAGAAKDPAQVHDVRVARSTSQGQRHQGRPELPSQRH